MIRNQQPQPQPPPRHPARRPAGFSLIEILAVILILSILLGVVVSMFGRSGATALRTASEDVMASVEQARTSAITRRKLVALAILEPGSGGFDDGSCRLGLFELDAEPSESGASGVLLARWQVLPSGVAFFGGQVDSLANVRDSATILLTWKNGSQQAEVHALVFTPRGGLAFPEGSESVVLTLGNGSYRTGSPVRTTHSGSRTIRIGRVVARAWSFDA